MAARVCRGITNQIILADIPSISVELSDCLMASESWDKQFQAGDEIEVDIKKEVSPCLHPSSSP
jgi:hypothetical protein